MTRTADARPAQLPKTREEITRGTVEALVWATIGWALVAVVISRLAPGPIEESGAVLLLGFVITFGMAVLGPDLIRRRRPSIQRSEGRTWDTSIAVEVLIAAGGSHALWRAGPVLLRGWATADVWVVIGLILLIVGAVIYVFQMLRPEGWLSSPITVATPVGAAIVALLIAIGLMATYGASELIASGRVTTVTCVDTPEFICAQLQPSPPIIPADLWPVLLTGGLAVVVAWATGVTLAATGVAAVLYLGLSFWIYEVWAAVDEREFVLGPAGPEVLGFQVLAVVALASTLVLIKLLVRAGTVGSLPQTA